MKLISQTAFQESPPQNIALRCKANIWVSLIPFAIFEMMMIAGVIAGIYESPFFYYFAVVGGLLSLWFGSMFRSALRPTSWILMDDGSGLWIHLRSYLNYHFPSDRFSILRLRRDEVEWIRLVKERRSLPSTRNREQVSFHKILQLKLNARDEDLEALEAALKADVFEKPKGSRSRYVHYPVVLRKSERLLLIEWSGYSPRISKVIRHLEAQYKNLEMEKLNWGHWRDLTDKQVDDLVIELVQFGNQMDAIRLLRSKRTMDLTEAKQFVEELKGGKIAS